MKKKQKNGKRVKGKKVSWKKCMENDEKLLWKLESSQ